MRKYISLFFSAIVVLCACNNTTPGGIIEKEKMINLLVDVHITDGTMFTTSSMPDSMYKYGTGKYLNVFKIHHTDSAQFNRSLKYYTTKPEILSTMYDAISKKLQVKSDSLSKVLVKENTKRSKQAPLKPTPRMYKGPDTGRVKLDRSKFIKRMTDTTRKTKNALPK